MKHKNMKNHQRCLAALTAAALAFVGYECGVVRTTDVLEARSVDILDADGAARIEMRAGDKGPTVQFRGKAQEVVMHLGVDDASGRTTLRVGSKESGGALTLVTDRDGNVKLSLESAVSGAPAAELVAGVDGTRLVISKDGRPIVVVGQHRQGVEVSVGRSDGEFSATMSTNDTGVACAISEGTAPRCVMGIGTDGSAGLRLLGEDGAGKVEVAAGRASGVSLLVTGKDGKEILFAGQSPKDDGVVRIRGEAR